MNTAPKSIPPIRFIPVGDGFPFMSGPLATHQCATNKATNETGVARRR